MANARQIIQRLTETNDPDSPESFDVKGHLDSPVARLAKTNGFVRNDRSEDEERWVKRLSDGKEAWLRTRQHSEYMPEPPLDMRDARSGRHWEFIIFKPKTNQFEQLASGSEMTMNYLLSAILQRLATWPEDLPRPGQPGWKKAFK